MTATELYEMLRKVQEPKGYYFNADMDLTMDLLESLLVNKERYGYMACPCRLACGERERDRDIICPCEYRTPDVEEYGCCYCQLYVNREWNQDAQCEIYVPERRPADRCTF